MADIGGYRHHVTGYPVTKDYYGTCAVDCDQFSTGNCSSYRQYGDASSCDVQSSCAYPVSYGARGDMSSMASSQVLSQAPCNAGSCSNVYRMSGNFRSDCSKLVQGQTNSTSSPMEIYPWMKETRQNHRRQMLASLPGPFTKAKAKLKLKLNKALDENSSLSYGASLAIWDHTVLPATRHK